jgi:hypothetical protein
MNDFFKSAAAIALGSVIGFTASRLIIQQMSAHAFNNCSDGKLEFARDFMMGDRFYCIK